jgi:hypothetical protein
LSAIWALAPVLNSHGPQTCLAMSSGDGPPAIWLAPWSFQRSSGVRTHYLVRAAQDDEQVRLAAVILASDLEFRGQLAASACLLDPGEDGSGARQDPMPAKAVTAAMTTPRTRMVAFTGGRPAATSMRRLAFCLPLSRATQEVSRRCHRVWGRSGSTCPAPWRRL